MHIHTVERSGPFDVCTMGAKIRRMGIEKMVECFLIVTQGGLDFRRMKHVVWHSSQQFHGGVSVHGTVRPVHKGMKEHAAEKSAGGRTGALHGLGRFFQRNTAVLGSKSAAAQETLIFKLVNLFKTIIRESKRIKKVAGVRTWVPTESQPVLSPSHVRPCLQWHRRAYRGP